MFPHSYRLPLPPDLNCLPNKMISLDHQCHQNSTISLLLLEVKLLKYPWLAFLHLMLPWTSKSAALQQLANEEAPSRDVHECWPGAAQDLALGLYHVFCTAVRQKREEWTWWLLFWSQGADWKHLTTAHFVLKAKKHSLHTKENKKYHFTILFKCHVPAYQTHLIFRSSHHASLATRRCEPVLPPQQTPSTTI